MWRPRQPRVSAFANITVKSNDEIENSDRLDLSSKCIERQG